MGEHWITNIDLSDRLQQKADITVATLAERNAIGVWRRKWKMIVGVYNDGANNGFYSLEHDLNSTSLGDNDNWQLIDNHSRLHPITGSTDHENLPAKTVVGNLDDAPAPAEAIPAEDYGAMPLDAPELGDIMVGNAADSFDYKKIDELVLPPFTASFNANGDWTAIAGGFEIQFNHGFGTTVDVEVRDSQKKISVRTESVSNDIERIVVPHDFRFAGMIKISRN